MNLLGLLLCTALASARAAEIQLFAAASLSDALKEIAVGFEKESGHRVRFNFGASSLLARQIQEGAPADVFISADEEKMDTLAKRGLILSKTRKVLLSNSLLVIVANDSRLQIEKLDDLRKARRIALGETRTVPAGIYARDYLERRGLWPELERKIIPTENVRAALATVEAGNADVAIVYKTDLAMGRKVKVAFAIPASDTPGISYPLALIKESKNAAHAPTLVEYLARPEAQNIFKRHGFLPPP